MLQFRIGVPPVYPGADIQYMSCDKRSGHCILDMDPLEVQLIVSPLWTHGLEEKKHCNVRLQRTKSGMRFGKSLFYSV